MLKPAQTPPTMFTLVYLTAVSILSLNMFLPSLPAVAEEFGVEYSVAALSVSGYLLVTGALQLIFGPLSDRYGRRPVLLWGAGLFVLGSIGCLLTENVVLFLAFRVVQGAIISAGAITRAVVRDMKPPQEAAAMLGTIGMVMALAPMIGPSVGGLIDQFFGWRTTFLAYVLLGIGAFALAWSDLGETNTNRSETIGAQFRNYPELLRSRIFWGHTICMSFSFGTFMSYLAGAPIIVTEFNLQPAWIGIGLGAPTMGFFLGNYLTRRFASRFAITTMTISGRVVSTGGLFAGLCLTLIFGPSVQLLFATSIFIGIGNGLTVPSATVGTMSIRPDLAGSAAGLSGAATIALSAPLTWIVTSLVPPQGGITLFLVLLLVIVSIGLLAALYTRYAEAKEA